MASQTDIFRTGRMLRRAENAAAHATAAHRQVRERTRGASVLDESPGAPNPGPGRGAWFRVGDGRRRLSGTRLRMLTKVIDRLIFEIARRRCYIPHRACRVVSWRGEVWAPTAQRIAFMIFILWSQAVFTSKLFPTSKNGKPRGKGACPSSLFARWREIREGGVVGDRDFGYEVLRVVPSLDPWQVEDEKWERRLGRLHSLIEASDDSAVLAWFAAEVPRIMALVPSRRREPFLVGLYAAVENEGCEIFSD